METYNLNVNNKVKEPNTIKQIYNNKYDPLLLNNLTPLANNTKTELNETKWAKYTHVSKETKFITELFWHTTLHVAYKTLQVNVYLSNTAINKKNMKKVAYTNYHAPTVIRSM